MTQIKVRAHSNKSIAALCGYFAILLAMTYPLFLNFTKYIPGFFSSDEPFAVLGSSWQVRFSLLHNIPLGVTPLIAHPFGVDLYGGGYVSYIWMAIFYFLSFVTTVIVEYNIQIVGNFLLSALFTYMLVFKLTQDRRSAFFSGIIFAFCPYQFMRSFQHIGLTYNEWIVFALFGAISLKENYSRKTVILFFLSLMFLFSFDWSIMYLGSVTLAIFFIYVLLHGLMAMRSKKAVFDKATFSYFKRIIFIGIIAFACLSIQFIPVFMNLATRRNTRPAAFNSYHRPFEDLFSQSALPLNYLLPSTNHPIFGNFTEQFVGGPLYGVSFTEHTLYLGWLSMILTFIAVKNWRARRRQHQIDEKENFYIGFFIFLAVVAWFFSQPPWWQIGPIRIYMPSFFMYKILPMFRAYCRFGIVVMCAVAVLAGFGLNSWLAKCKSQRSKIAVTLFCCGVVLFEFWNWPPYKVIDVSKVPEVYYWIKNQPGDFAIAEYPLDASSPNETYKLYQATHEKKIINGTTPGTKANLFAQKIIQLSEPHTAGVLKWMGVKYVLVHHDGYENTEQVQVIDELNNIPKNKGLRLVRSFPAQDCPSPDIMCVQKTGPIDVYEVIAQSVIPSKGG